MWKETDDVNRGKEKSEMSIPEILNLIERTLILVGQANVSCLYKRRVNSMAQILKGMTPAKQALTQIQNLQTNSRNALFGDSFYNVLYRKGKNRKGPKRLQRNLAFIQREVEVCRPFSRAFPVTKGIRRVGLAGAEP